jgi:ectoine hydroxylase-related dioxygenase (phytanoyl-CoA dioxygenase family)
MKKESKRLLYERDPDWEKHGNDGHRFFEHPHKHSELFLSIVKDKKIIDIVETLMQYDLNNPELKIEATQTWMYFKPPGELGRDVHQNIFYSHTNVGEVINISIAIDDADVENGCVYYYPGSHKERICYPIPDSSHTEFASMDKERIKTNPKNQPNERGKSIYVPGTWVDGKWKDKYPKIYPPSSAGSVSILDSHILHGSDENNSVDRWRRAFLIQYQPKGKLDIVGRGSHMKRESINVYDKQGEFDE